MNVIPRHTIETPSNFHYEENGIKYISKKYVNYVKAFPFVPVPVPAAKAPALFV